MKKFLYDYNKTKSIKKVKLKVKKIGEDLSSSIDLILLPNVEHYNVTEEEFQEITPKANKIYFIDNGEEQIIEPNAYAGSDSLIQFVSEILNSEKINKFLESQS